MPEIFPFRGYRFDAAKVGSLSQVATQPYDKISEEMRKAYLARHPFNIVRLIKNPDYKDAAAFLDGLIEQGVLRRDISPSFYPYQQRFLFEGTTLTRIGLVALLSLEGSEMSVRGHERVLDKPMLDRLNLIRATEVNDGLIFSLYEEASGTIDSLLEEFTESTPPAYQFDDDFGTEHRLWQLSDAVLQKQIAATLKPLPFYIADGHHRFQTAQRYYHECLEAGWKPAAPESFDKRMVALFNMSHPSLKILPTHRALRDHPSFDGQALLSSLEKNFKVVRLTELDQMTEQMRGPGQRIGLALRGGEYYLLRVRPESLGDPDFMADTSGLARQLDVNVLHEGILAPLLGLGPSEIASQKYIDYYRDRSQLLSQVETGRYQAAFFLNSTTLQQVRDISDRRERMPQKSTDFFPKLLTGLVLSKMEIEKP